MTVKEFLIGDDRVFPGNSLPALLYINALDIPCCSRQPTFPTLSKKMAGYHHYHSTTHEVLGIYSGKSTIQLGDDKGLTTMLEKSDVLVIPAGVAHKKLDKEKDMGVVGAYPDGRDYDMTMASPESGQKLTKIWHRYPFHTQIRWVPKH